MIFKNKDGSIYKIEVEIKEREIPVLPDSSEFKPLEDKIDRIKKAVLELEEVINFKVDKKQEEIWREEAIDKGKDPDEYIEDKTLKQEIKAMKAEKALEKIKQENDEAIKKHYEADKAEFERSYPKVSVGVFQTNKALSKFAKHKIGNQPLTEIYADFLEITGEIASSTAASAASKAERSTGTSEGTSKLSLTPSQQKRLKEWNERFPNLKMTVKEFLEQ